ncbi:MAG: response regulator [Candidatus Gastranaerophilales bacterium]|nr:response regulator [Candidatus Gastranaerophilales bacterium]
MQEGNSDDARERLHNLCETDQKLVFGNNIYEIYESMGMTAQKDDPIEALRRSRRPTGKSAGRQPEGRKKILLVDDAAIQLRTMQSMLKKNYDVMMATSGQEAVRVIRKSRPDLILLDYDMPNCDGRETFEKIRNEENGEDVPVVFVTGVKEKERIMAVLKLKPEGYLIKPVKQSDLMELVKQVLGQ